jgi:dihydrofolate reductase
MTRLALVVAVAQNGTIGRGGSLPWHLPDDLKRFKAITMGKPIVMGRRTFESIGRALPGRRNIVVTRSPGFRAEGVTVAHSLGEALAAAGSDPVAGEAGEGAVDEIMVIGGAELYREALPLAQRIYLTRVHADVEGDVRFPALDPGEWRATSSERREPDARHAHALTYEVLERSASATGARPPRVSSP